MVYVSLGWVGFPPMAGGVAFRARISQNFWRLMGCRFGPGNPSAWWVGRETNPKHCRASLIWVVVSNIFYFHPYLGKWSNLTNIFQGGWNHQLVMLNKPMTHPWDDFLIFAYMNNWLFHGKWSYIYHTWILWEGLEKKHRDYSGMKM